MIINDVSGVSGAQPVQPNNRVNKAQKAYGAQPAAKADAAEISMEAKLLDKLRNVPEVRQEKVDALKAQIEAGTYDTPERIDAMVSKLLSDGDDV